MFHGPWLVLKLWSLSISRIKSIIKSCVGFGFLHILCTFVTLFWPFYPPSLCPYMTKLPIFLPFQSILLSCYFVIFYWIIRGFIPFLWRTGRALKEYFGKLVGLWGQSYEADKQQWLIARKGWTVRCYTLSVVIDCCYIQGVFTGCCCYRFLLHIGFYYKLLHTGCYYTSRGSAITSTMLSSVMSHHPKPPFAQCCYTKARNVGTIPHNICR